MILLVAITLRDRRLPEADRASWSLREFGSTFYLNPRKSPDFAWALASRFMLLLAYAFLATYQAYDLLDKIDSADVPHQIVLGTLVRPPSSSPRPSSRAGSPTAPADGRSPC